jgi:hypothetical protein
MFFSRLSVIWLCLLMAALSGLAPAHGQVLDKQRLLEEQTFWDNRDFEWYASHIPFFECPDADITTTYYYRWDLLTKHLTYGSPNSGYSFTEFIDRPFWSGAYGAISCPAGHQLYEARWLRNPRIARDYARYWLRTPGAQPRNYSTWLADSVWSVHQVHPSRAYTLDLLPDLVANYEAWERRHFVPEVGLFWQTGHDDGMEFNINSRQTQDILRGAPSYRPSFNAYMWADSIAIARMARLAGDEALAERFETSAASLKDKMEEILWDNRRQFFFPAFKNDEMRDGFEIQALSRTYESGQFAGSPHGRELIGYVPWQFNMFPGGSQYDVAWQKLMQRDGFYADFGPSTVERNDPMFLLQQSCCWWSGQSWPYATTQTLKGLANLLHNGGTVLTAADYVELLGIYARSHRKDGRPYLAEALHPDTGSFDGHDGYNHSEHYLHSGYCDLVITGLVGLVPRDDDTLQFQPLAPAEWEYFAMDAIPYRGYTLSVLWDKDGTRYGHGKGLHVLVDGQRVGRADRLQALTIENAVPLRPSSEVEGEAAASGLVLTNFAVNNDGTYFPRVTASYTSPGTSVAKLHDGNYWYLQHPPNRWTTQGSAAAEDWIHVDLGVSRKIDTIKLYVLDDSHISDSSIRAPQRVDIEVWNEGTWSRLADVAAKDYGGRPLVHRFDQPQPCSMLRFTLHHQPGFASGLTEVEVWGEVELPLAPVPPPAGNLAYNAGGATYPRAAASFTDRFGGKPQAAIDGITNFLPSPMNRWTSYESPTETDWLEIDFGQPIEFRRVELAIYDDRGGVQPPESYSLEKWTGDKWLGIEDVIKNPPQPAGGQWNTASFPPVTTSKLKIVFTHQGQARSGVCEVMVWNE